MSMRTYELLILIIVYSDALKFLPFDSQDESLQIKLEEGTIQGQVRTKSNISYYSFEGIPYAKPPIGKLRFQAPQSAEKWDGVLDATNGNNTPICMQIPDKSKEFNESEDCLYLNLFIPRIKTEQLLPIMVWIYGGAFLFGRATADYFGPEFLLNNSVIVIHFNYRVNIFGFLSTGDEYLPGNYGLKDQQFLLKWVQRNARNFNGDPQRVTIFGESAGGASVQYHLLSPQSSGLFWAAISQSGSALCSWAFQREPSKVAYEIAFVSGIRAKSTKYLAKHLRRMNAGQLKKAAILVAIKNSLNLITGLPFGPSLEPNISGAFISTHNHELLKNGVFNKVPYIIGFNSQEALIGEPALKYLDLVLRVLKSNPGLIIPPGLGTEDRAATKRIGQMIKSYYFEANNMTTTSQYLQVCVYCIRLYGK